MKKTIVSIIFFLFFGLISYSQKWNTLIDLGDLAAKSTKTPKELVNSEDNSLVIGSKFLYEEFLLGTIVLKSDTLIEGIGFRYNIYEKQMEMFVNSDTLALIHPEKVKTLFFDRKLFVYTGFEEKNKVQMDYFQVLAEGKYNLLLHYKVLYIPKNPPITPYSAGTIYDKYELTTRYFYQVDDKSAQLLSKNTKKILSLFTDRKPEMDKYIKEKNLKTTNEKDLIEIFRYYNSLK